MRRSSRKVGDRFALLWFDFKSPKLLREVIKKLRARILKYGDKFSNERSSDLGQENFEVMEVEKASHGQTW
jgi:hypothetical protein